MILRIDKEGRIDRGPGNSDLEMEVFGRRAPGPSGQSDRISGFDYVIGPDQILVLM